MIIEIFFFAVMVILVTIGMLCSARLDDRNPCWVRWIVLSPCLVALFTTFRMLEGQYVPYVEDVLFYLALALNYMLIFSRFTKNPWLAIRTKKWLEEQEKNA